MGFLMPEQSDIDTGSVTGSYLEKAGGYHLVVDAVEQPAVDRNNNLLDGSEVRLRGRVLAGTNKDQIGHSFNVILNSPKMSSSDQGRFASMILARAAYVLGILPQAQPGQQVEVNWHNAIGKDFLAWFEDHSYNSNEGKEVTTVRLSKNKMWTIAESQVCGIPVGERPAMTTVRQQVQQQQPAAPVAPQAAPVTPQPQQQVFPPQQPAPAQQQPQAAPQQSSPNWDGLTG